MKMGTLLVRGMLVGLLAAVLALGFASLFGEPVVDSAISFEEHGGGGHDHGTEPDAAGHEAPAVSRGVQSTIGLATAIGVYGLAFGGLFALAFAFAYGRLGGISTRATSVALGLGAFVVVFLVPYLKYPANPPAVGVAETIQDRTTWYFTMVFVSLAAAVAAVVLARRLAASLGAWNAALLGVLGYLVVVVAAVLLLPEINEVPDGFPASLLWDFRLAALGTQLVLWTALGVLFGVFTERRLQRAERPTTIAV